MKTLTEFSTLTLRKAAEARASAGGSATAPAPAPEAAAAPEGGAEGGAEGDAEAAPAPAAADPAIDAVATALSVQPDRAARLLEALDIVGNQLDKVRLVRVYQGETGPTGAVSRGEFHYVIDRVAGAAPRRDDRGGDRREGRGGDRGRGGPGGGGGRGDRDKPRGLGSLKAGGVREEKKDDDRPGRGEMPRAGLGWQLTAAPREEGRGRGKGGPGGRGPGGRGPGGRGPGGPGGDRRGPGGPGGDRRGPGGPGGFGRGPREQRLGPDGQPLPDNRPPRGPRPPRPPREAGAGGPRPEQPRLGPDGQPLPPRPRRERKPFGPDANGLGPDGKPWDPERRAKRVAERGPVNTAGGAAVEAPAAAAPAEATKE